MIFISYSWNDSFFARLAFGFLIETGHQVWIDYLNLDITKPIEPQLMKAIWASSCIVYLDSSSSQNSSWVQYELAVAAVLSKPVKSISVPNDTGLMEFLCTE